MIVVDTNVITYLLLPTPMTAAAEALYETDRRQTPATRLPRQSGGSAGWPVAQVPDRTLCDTFW